MQIRLCKLDRITKYKVRTSLCYRLAGRTEFAADFRCYDAMLRTAVKVSSDRFYFAATHIAVPHWRSAILKCVVGIFRDAACRSDASQSVV